MIYVGTFLILDYRHLFIIKSQKIMKKILVILISVILLPMINSCEEENFGNENLNEFIVGNWVINNNSGHIEFTQDCMLFMNDTIYGNYEFNEGNPNEAFLYFETENGSYDESTLKFLRYVSNYNTVMVDGLPFSETTDTLYRIK